MKQDTFLITFADGTSGEFYGFWIEEAIEDARRMSASKIVRVEIRA